jgi:hypothetical protein
MVQNASVLVWDGSIDGCPYLEGSKSLLVQLWTSQHRHPLTKRDVEMLVFAAAVDMGRIPLYMISGGNYLVKSEDEETQRFFSEMVNRTDLAVGLLAQVIYKDPVTFRPAAMSPEKSKVNDQPPDWVLFYVEHNSQHEGQLHAVCVTRVPYWHQIEYSGQIKETNPALEKQKADLRGIKIEDGEREVTHAENIPLLENTTIGNINEVPIKEEDLGQLSAVVAKDSALEKLQRRRSSSITPFSKAAQKSITAFNKENIYTRPKLDVKLERRFSVGKLIPKQQYQQQQQHHLATASRESSVASDSLTEFEKRDMAVIQRVILAELRMRGIGRDNCEQKQLYHHTYKALCFALRAKLSLGSGIELDEIQEKADKLLSIFIG